MKRYQQIKARPLHETISSDRVFIVPAFVYIRVPTGETDEDLKSKIDDILWKMSSECSDKLSTLVYDEVLPVMEIDPYAENVMSVLELYDEETLVDKVHKAQDNIDSDQS